MHLSRLGTRLILVPVVVPGHAGGALHPALCLNQRHLLAAAHVDFGPRAQPVQTPGVHPVPPRDPACGVETELQITSAPSTYYRMTGM